MGKKWKKETLKLKPDHGWKAKPGYKIFVADRGAVRFDIPQDWVMEPGADAIKFHDKQPPDADCILQVTVFHLHPGVDWSALPLPRLLEQAMEGDREDVIHRGEIAHLKRKDLELAWRETRYMETEENREARSRSCLARGNNVQPLITLDYWPEDADRFLPVWEEVLGTLRLGEYVKDPTSRSYLN